MGTITIDLASEALSTPTHVTDPASAEFVLSEAAEGNMPGATFTFTADDSELVAQLREVENGQKIHSLIIELARRGKDHGVGSRPTHAG